MINFFTLGLNQMITLAEQVQRLESELFRMFLRNVSTSTQRLGNLSQMGQSGASKMMEMAGQATEAAEEEMEQMHETMRPAVSSRAKASSTRQRSKTQPKRPSRKR